MDTTDSQNTHNVNILSEICKDLQDLYYLQEYGTEDQKVNLVLGVMTKYELKLQQSLDIKLVTLVQKKEPESEFNLKIQGKLYRSSPELIGCEGCVGNENQELCDELIEEVSCSSNNIIWIRSE